MTGWKGGFAINPYLEGKGLKTSGQTGKRLVSGTGLGYDSQLGSRALRLSGSDLETSSIGGLEGAGTSRGAGEAATRDCASTARVAESLLRRPRKSRSRNHCGDGVAVNWQFRFA